MKIISKFKDYYDYVGKIYGEDEKITYNRLDLPLEGKQQILIPTPFKNNSQDFYTMQERYGSLEGFNVHQLIVCGYVFTVEKPSYSYGHEHYKALTPEHLAEISDTRKRRYYYFNQKKHYYNGEFSEQAKTLCKVLKQPVIVYTGLSGRDHLGFCNRIPSLAEAGIANKFTAEEMFQMIQQFISNEIRENPDIKPPVEVEDKYKIIGHGFDLKTSFRHRKDS